MRKRMASSPGCFCKKRHALGSITQMHFWTWHVSTARQLSVNDLATNCSYTDAFNMSKRMCVMKVLGAMALLDNLAWGTQSCSNQFCMAWNLSVVAVGPWVFNLLVAFAWRNVIKPSTHRLSGHFGPISGPAKIHGIWFACAHSGLFSLFVFLKTTDIDSIAIFAWSCESWPHYRSPILQSTWRRTFWYMPTVAGVRTGSMAWAALHVDSPRIPRTPLSEATGW